MSWAWKMHAMERERERERAQLHRLHLWQIEWQSECEESNNFFFARRWQLLSTLIACANAASSQFTGERMRMQIIMSSLSNCTQREDQIRSLANKRWKTVEWLNLLSSSSQVNICILITNANSSFICVQCVCTFGTLLQKELQTDKPEVKEEWMREKSCIRQMKKRKNVHSCCLSWWWVHQEYIKGEKKNRNLMFGPCFYFFSFLFIWLALSPSLCLTSSFILKRESECTHDSSDR